MFQYGALVLGIILATSGFLELFNQNVGAGAALSLGAMGWFACGCLMSPTVRQDLFGDRFESSSRP